MPTINNREFKDQSLNAYDNYKSYEANISGATTYEVETDLGRLGKHFILRTDAGVTVKLNDSGNDSITVDADEGFLSTEGLERFLIVKIIVTPSTSANIKLLVF